MVTPEAATDPTASARQAPEAMFAHGTKPGTRLAAGLLFALALALLAQLWTETRWFKRVDWPLQPRFWPGVVLAGLTLFAGAFFAQTLRGRSRAQRPAARDQSDWRRAIEFALWFVAYAAVIPWVGYLAATLVFMPLLGLRVGLRAPATLLALAAIGLAAVLFFKTGLEVKIPAGAIYELLPDGPRNFMIRNF